MFKAIYFSALCCVILCLINNTNLIAQEFALDTIHGEEVVIQTERKTCVKTFQDDFGKSKLKVDKKKVQFHISTIYRNEPEKKIEIPGTAVLTKKLITGEPQLKKINLKVRSDSLYDKHLADYKDYLHNIMEPLIFRRIFPTEVMKKYFSCRNLKDKEWVFVTNDKIKGEINKKMTGDDPDAIPFEGDIEIYTRLTTNGNLKVMEFKVQKPHSKKSFATTKTIKYSFGQESNRIRLAHLISQTINEKEESITEIKIDL